MLYYSVLPCKITRWKALVTHAQCVCEYIDCGSASVSPALLYWPARLLEEAELGWVARLHPASLTWSCPIFI